MLKNDQISLDANPSDEEIKQIREKLYSYNLDQTHDAYGQPGIEIKLALRNSNEDVIGGIIASTMLWVMHLEVLWVADEYRRRGFGSQLVLAAEEIGRKRGCDTSHTWTFEFQGPQFYPKIGYELIGVYDGYPNQLKEYVFKKDLTNHPGHIEAHKLASNDLYLTEDLSPKDIETLHAGLRSHVDKFVGDEKNGIGIKLVLKDPNGETVGGLHAWTTIHNLLVEFVWVDEEYRGAGLGTQLLKRAESIAKQKNACIAALVCPMSFHSPGFFRKNGFQEFGYSDGYPEPFREYYFIKKF
jgi:GNAT superfamily N-acetyltransferase